MSTISQVQALKWPDLPSVVPLIYHRYRRQRPLRAEAVALSLYQLYDRRTGLPRYSTREQLAAAFRIDPGQPCCLPARIATRPSKTGGVKSTNGYSEI